MERIKIVYNRLKSSKLFSDSFWSIIGSVVGKGLSVIAGIYVARLLGKEVYGEYGIIRNTLIYIEIFSTFGLGYTSTKYISNYLADQKEKIGPVVKGAINITFITSLIIALVLGIFSKQFAQFVNASHLHRTFMFASVAIVFNAVNVAQTGILSGFRNFSGIAKNTTICGIVTFILTIILTYKLGLNGSIVALVISYITQCLLNNILIRKTLKDFDTGKECTKQTYWELLSYSFPIALQEGLYSVTNWLVSLVLIKLSGYGELGMFTAAAQISALIGFLPSILSNVTLAHLANTITDIDKHNKTRRIMLLTNFVSTTSIFVVILTFSDVLQILFGKSFDGLSYVFAISCITAIISSLSSVYVQEFLSVSKNWFLFVARVVRDGCTLLLGYLLLCWNSTDGAMLMCIAILSANILYFIVLFTRFITIKNGKKLFN